MLKSKIQTRAWVECDAANGACQSKTDEMLSEQEARTVANMLGWKKDAETGKTYCPSHIASAEEHGMQLVPL
jgi:hypothetical protein